MPIQNYISGYPKDGQSLGDSKTVVRNNLDGTFQTLGIDHQTQNQATPGYHTVIHQTTQSSVSTIAGVNQIFSGVPGTLSVNSVTTKAIPSNGDTQLYALTGMGGLSQLTGHSALANGYVWCSGLLLQWGIVNAPGSNGTVTFATANVSFPTNCFSVQLTPRNDGSHSAFTYYLDGQPTNLAFSYRGSTSGSQALYWFAVGN